MIYTFEFDHFDRIYFRIVMALNPCQCTSRQGAKCGTGYGKVTAWLRQNTVMDGHGHMGEACGLLLFMLLIVHVRRFRIQVLKACRCVQFHGLPSSSVFCTIL